MKETRLFVGNLSYKTTENDLQDLFSQAGVVTSCSVMQDKFTGKSRGFAFLEMSTAEEANKAIEMWNGKDCDGRALTVNIARPREEGGAPRAGGGYRGGGGGGGGGRQGGGGGGYRERDRERY